ncbi:MAG: MCE family protein [Chitinispirillaceae bacterium]|nr:MCE family protein [Chitinispirillaceae bacterium]
MKKTDIDLIVGASILAAILILISGVLWLKEVSISRKMVNYAVLFPNVGTLQVGDPVMVNGVSKGMVKQIFLRGKDVAVVLELEKSIHLTDSCRIMIQNIGLMGERGVGLQYSERGTAVKPVKNRDTTFLRGSFDTGIAEAMGMLGTVLGEVQTLAGNLAAIVEQTVGDSSFISSFKAIVERLDTISLAVQDLLGDNRSAIDRSIGNLQTLSEEVKQLLQRNSPGIDSMVADGEALTSRAVIIAGTVDTLTRSVQTILDQLQDRESSIGKILHDKELYSDLRTTVADLDTLVRSVQEDALKLRIKFGFGKKRN